MKDRLAELLMRYERLYGVICRDATLTDIELYAAAGYHIIWIDLEHSPQSAARALRLCRTIAHLGMVPLVRIIELSRTHVQRLLDGGAQIITLPDVRSGAEATELVRLGKFPPMGHRGVSTSCAGTDFTLGPDPRRALREANDATHLMVMFESDSGHERLDEILGVDGVDLVTIGPMDWSVSLGLYGDQAKAHLAPKIDRILTTAAETGKVAAMGVSSAEQARQYRDLGVRIFFVGVDVAIKRDVMAQTVGAYRDALERA